MQALGESGSIAESAFRLFQLACRFVIRLFAWIIVKGLKYLFDSIQNGALFSKSFQQNGPHRTALANGEYGIRDRQPAPTLSEFCE